ncbi:MAG: hypothetical protein ACREN4_02620 [Candidatus Dormibacteria bacterium]
MRRYRQRIVLGAVAGLGLAGLGFGVASLSARGVSAAQPGSARVLAATSSPSPSAPAMHNCPNMPGSSRSSS